LSLSSGAGGVLVSGSADKTVRLWDVNDKKQVAVFTHHSDKVQSVLVHGTEANVVATAGYDRVLAVVDMRSGGVHKVGIGAGADPEGLMWAGDYELMISCENGVVSMFDVRNMSGTTAAAVWSFEAHEGTCTSMTKLDKGQFVSVGADGLAKVWNMRGAGVPELVKLKDMKTGPLFAVAGVEDHPGYVAFGGSEPGIWAV
jgi:periodic tryptophan protein 1